MQKLYLFNYNNYFNRIVKKKDTISEYGTPIYTIDKCNFVYADGVSTEHIVNYAGNDGDYVIITDLENNILHRWFVTESYQTREGQHRLYLRRDLMADYLDDITSNPMLINRGMVQTVTNPLVLNSEGMSFNQIKTKEILLKDAEALNCPWYVLYFDKRASNLEKNITYGGTVVPEVIAATTNLSALVGTHPMLYKGVQGRVDWIPNGGSYNYYYRDYINYKDQFNDGKLSGWLWVEEYSLSGFKDCIWFKQNQSECQSWQTAAFGITLDFYNYAKEVEAPILLDAGISPSTDPGYISRAQYEQYWSWNGKTVRDSSNNIYRVTVTEEDAEIRTGYIETGNFVTWAKSRINATELTREGDWGDKTFGYSVYRKKLSFSISQIPDDSYTIKVNDGSKITTENSDYLIIALPAPETTVVCATTANTFNTIQGTTQKQLLDAIQSNYTSEQLVDIQLFPYCPYQPALENILYRINVRDIDAGLSTTAGVPTNLSLILQVPYANFSFNINKSLLVENIEDSTADPRPIDYKVYNETKLYRLVSPNGNGNFEFNLAKNGGSIDYINVDVTLRPIQPYLHLNIDFKSIYGSDFNDCRGLICQGNFSIPRHSSAFLEYAYNNRNYQDSFDRSIKHMDFVQGQERTRALVGAISGTLTGATAGAITGAKVGGTAGAVAGMALGGAASVAGAVMDFNMMAARQAEDKAYALDNFKYQLGNVKALGESTTGITPLTYNNKIYPYLEVYECSDEELDAFTNYINYRSMNLNVIGNFMDYVTVGSISFISGQLLRLDTIHCSANEAYALDNELKQGVYYDSRSN